MSQSDKFWRREIQGYDPWACDKSVYVFREEIAERVIAWWEAHLTLSKAGVPFLLEDWQKQLVGHLFAWKKRTDGLRRYRKLWLYIPRKNGKTELGAGLAIVALVADNEKGAEVYSAAGDVDQAKLVFDAAAAMVRNNSLLNAEIRILEGYKSMKYSATQSYWRVLSRDSGTKHGLNPHMYIVDEVHAHRTAELMEVLETGTGARQQPLGIYLTTADYSRESACNIYHDYAKRVRDENIDDTWLPVIYELSTDDDWHDEALWKNANPNLGVCKTWDYMRQQYHTAVNMPSFENTFKRLDLNIQTTAQNKWLNVDDWDACLLPDVTLEDLAGEECYVAIDMSATRDLTACGMFFPARMLYVCQHWSPEAQIEQRLEYQLWQRDGWLTPTPGRTINSGYIREYVRAVSEKYKILGVAYDKYNAVELACQLGDGDGIPVVEFRQGFLSMNEPAKKLEKLLLDHELRHNGNPILRWMVSNVEILTDPTASIKPVKPAVDSPKKIDGIVCLVMCLGLWINQEPDTTPTAYSDRMALTGDAMLVL